MRVCPFCSTENEAFFRFCLGCGADLDEVVGAEDEAAAAPKTSVSPSAAVPPKAYASSSASVPQAAAVATSRADAVAPAMAKAVPPEIAKAFERAAAAGDATAPDGLPAVVIPKPRVSSKDTAVDMPAVTPELLAQMKGGKETRASKAQGARVSAPQSPPSTPVMKVPDSAAVSATKAVEPAPKVAAAAPSASPGSPPPRVARDRDKTLDPGGAVKSGSAASQAVAQAQGEARKQTGPTEQVGAGPAVASRVGTVTAMRGASASPPEPAGPTDPTDPSIGGEATDPVRTKPTAVSSTGPRSAAAGREQRMPSTGSPEGAARTSDSAAAARKSGSVEAPPGAKRAAGVKAPKARLVIILEDGTDGSILDLGSETTIVGREGVDIVFPHDDFLAKRHAEFTFADGVLYLRPLESTNGVFLQVHQEVELDNGDVFRIGQQLLCFEMLSMVAAALAVDPKGQAIPLGSPLPEGAWGRLGQLIAPETLGSVYLLGGNEVYLGRERGDITFPGDGFVSGLHAQISMRNGRCFLKDLGSSNGTYLRLSKATPVRRGMLVLAGQQLFRVES